MNDSNSFFSKRSNPLPGAHTLLVLTSEHRVSTRLNFDATFWAKRVMSSIQQNILHVLCDRAERASSTLIARSDMPLNSQIMKRAALALRAATQ